MIVKDEEDIILRALRSVRNIIDYYCICDTGSSDNTVSLIEQYLEENKLSGVVHKRPWVSFAHNRTEAFNLAAGKCDYLMTLDADEVLAAFINNNPDETKIIKQLPELTADMYAIKTWKPRSSWDRLQLFKDGLDWTWKSPVHEVCVSDKAKSRDRISHCCILPQTDGARAKDPDRFAYDAIAFTKALREDPTNTRYNFYLAQSYQDSGKPDYAIKSYKDCLRYSSWDEERFICSLRIARLLHSKEGFEVACPWYWKSYNERPCRAESLYELYVHYNSNEMTALKNLIKSLLVKCDASKDILFVEHKVYDWINRELKNEV